ncbi:MAG: MFS transporter, partial [Lysobacteraceae bacterium]
GFSVASTTDGVLSSEGGLLEVATPGRDIWGTIGDRGACGRGQLLTGGEGTPVAGLQVRYQGTVTTDPDAGEGAEIAGRVAVFQNSLVFQVGGNFGTALGPLIAAAVIVPHGQHAASWFAGAALIGIALLTYVGRWYALHLGTPRPASTASMAPRHPPRTVAKVLAILLVLIFSKYFYMASIGSYFTFYLIHHFGIPVAQAQLHLFAFLVASAAGGFLGGPLGDRIGRKPIIWTSILGVAPFALMLPHADLFWTTVLAVLIGFVLSSAFSAIVVYAQEMMPHRIGMVSGLFFGFAFGMGGLGAAVLGLLADKTSIEYVYQLTAFLPLLGIVAAWLSPSRPAVH